MNPATSLHTADLLIRQARILWPGSDQHGKRCDLSIRKGKLEKIGESLEAAEDQRSIEAHNLHLSPGWSDLNVDFRDPGNEDKEDLYSGMQAAMQGGFTRVLLMPSTDPPLDHRGAIEDVKARAQGHPLTLHPAGALSKGRTGKDIAELYDMYRSGALAFTDGRRPVNDAGLLINALLYTKTFDARLFLYPDDPTISRQGVMHEGELSTRLGMKGIPTMSEKVAVDRILHLLEYTEGRVHLSTLSTREALESVRKAKASGLRVTCDVAAHHLYLDEEELQGFSSLFKIMPPLRDKGTVEALREGLLDGTVDHVCSLHEPQAEEDKRVEFEVAGNGAPGLETSFGALKKAMSDQLNDERLMSLFVQKPRELLGLEIPELKEGVSLEATLFDPEHTWTCKQEDLRSKAYKSPYEGKELQGKVLGTVHQGLFHSCLDDER